MPVVRLRPKARADLEDIWRYTVERWGIDQAVSYIDDLDTAFKRLLDHPLAARERAEFSPPVRIVQHASHLIVYLTDDRGITISARAA